MKLLALRIENECGKIQLYVDTVTALVEEGVHISTVTHVLVNPFSSK